MTLLHDTVRSYANQFRHSGRSESGRRMLALLALGILAHQTRLAGDWQRLRNDAAHLDDDAAIQRKIVSLAKDVEQEIPALRGAFTEVLISDVTHAGAALPSLVLAAAQMVEFQVCEQAPSSEFYDAAVTEFGHNGPAGELGTPQQLAKLMVELLQLQAGASVLDPNCGLGTTLSEVVRREPKCKVTGIGINPLEAALARLRLHFMGASAEISVANMLSAKNSLYEEDRFDYLICNPPISVKLPLHERTLFANKYDFGNAAIRSEVLFLLKCAEYVRNGVRAAVVMPIAFLFRASDLGVRQWLLDRRQIEGVISLPTGVIPWTELAFAIVILRAVGEGSEKVRLIDGEGLGVRTRRGAERLTQEHIAWLVSQYGEAHVEGPGSIMVHVSKLMQHDSNLRPQIWLHAPEAKSSDLGALYQDAREAEREANSIAEQIDSLAVMLRLTH